MLSCMLTNPDLLQLLPLDSQRAQTALRTKFDFTLSQVSLQTFILVLLISNIH